MQKTDILHIGVTGGIGSGKTTFCKVWQELGAHVVFADTLAKDLMTRDNRLRKEIVRAFGKQAYDSDGSLNRKWLAEKAFGEGRVNELNALVHPAVYRELNRLRNHAARNNAPFFAHESALLLIEGNKAKCDVVVVITAPEKERINRVMTRDRVSKEEVSQRMLRQGDPGIMESDADMVVCNDGTADQLREKAKELFHLFAAKTCPKLIAKHDQKHQP